MNTYSPIVVKVLLLFRSAKETANIISGVIQQIGSLTHFLHQQELELFLKPLSNNLEILLLANAIDAIRVSFAGETVEIQLVSPKHGSEQDEIDLSLLEIVPVKTANLHLDILSSNPELIKPGTIEKVESITPGSIVVTLSTSTASVEDRINLPVPVGGRQDWLADVSLPEVSRASTDDLIDFLS